MTKCLKKWCCERALKASIFRNHPVSIAIITLEIAACFCSVRNHRQSPCITRYYI